jgi:xanthine dehydrogenase accessory factor
MVFGCGHVGLALIEAALPLGFHIVAIDDLNAPAVAQRFSAVRRVIQSYAPEDFVDLPFGNDAYVVIATRDHAHDQSLVEYCLTQPTRYLGVIGSRRKARIQHEQLLAKGFSEEDLRRIHCPIGIDIGAETPEEIAISICAELVQVLRETPQSLTAEKESCPLLP